MVSLVRVQTDFSSLFGGIQTHLSRDVPCLEVMTPLGCCRKEMVPNIPPHIVKDSESCFTVRGKNRDWKTYLQKSVPSS